MTLLGKIFTVLIFIMSVSFCILAVATFATHRNWKVDAMAKKAEIEKLQGELKDKTTEILNAKNELAIEQASRRSALATLQAKLSLLLADLTKYTEELSQKNSQLTEETQAAKVAVESLAAITAETAKLREEIRLAQQDRNDQYLKAVTLVDKLNQADALREQLEVRNAQLQDLYAQLDRVAKRMGFNKESLVSAIPPPVDGVITAINEAQGLVEVSIGADDGLKKGHMLQVFQGEKYLGQIILREVNKDKAVGDIDKKMQRGRMKKGDNVTTKLS